MGPFTGRPALAGFFGFFGFFAWTAIVNDERLQVSSALACRNAFVAAIAMFALTMIATLVWSGAGPTLVVYAYAFSFAAQMLTFTISFVYYDLVGDRA
jgi:hypothetical protein